MENEVREVIYLAISTILLSIVLGVASFAIALNGDMAEIRNGQTNGVRQIMEYKEFNKYDRHEVVGDDVIECIRMYYDSGLDIFIDSRTNSEIPKTIDEVDTGRCPLCKRDYDHRMYNLEQYLAHKDSSGANYFKISMAATSRPKDDMRNWFPTDVKYRAYCVYNSEPVVDVYARMMEKYAPYSSLTGQAALNALDSCAMDRPINAEVTGLIFIAYSNINN